MSAISLGYSGFYLAATMEANTSSIGRSLNFLSNTRKEYTTAARVLSYLIDACKAPKARVTQTADIIKVIHHERLRLISANPSLAEFFTVELAVKSAYLRLLRNTLSEKASARVERLAQSPDDWDGQGGKAMTLGALINFADFSRQIDINRNDLGIYLNYEGKILASWLLDNGTTIDLAFGDSQVEIVTDDYEMTFAASDKEMFRFIKEQ